MSNDEKYARICQLELKLRNAVVIAESLFERYTEATEMYVQTACDYNAYVDPTSSFEKKYLWNPLSLWRELFEDLWKLNCYQVAIINNLRNFIPIVKSHVDEWLDLQSQMHDTDISDQGNSLNGDINSMKNALNKLETQNQVIKPMLDYVQDLIKQREKFDSQASQSTITN